MGCDIFIKICVDVLNMSCTDNKREREKDKHTQREMEVNVVADFTNVGGV